MNCSPECLSTYSSASPNMITDGAVFAPYVMVSFTTPDGTRQITVGNNSSPKSNQAVVSKFQYGYGNSTAGWGAEVEITDNGGVLYNQILYAINQTITDVQKDMQSSYFQFGWIKKFVDDSVKLEISPPLHGMILEATTTHEDGCVKLNLKFGCPFSKMPDVRKDVPLGGDFNGQLTLKEALTKIFTEYDPKFSAVNFVDRDGGELKFANSPADAPGEGPREPHPVNQLNQLAIARSWLENKLTVNDLGCTIGQDVTSGAVVIQEDNRPYKKNESPPLATYIVGGGNCSPVLSFHPTLTWNPGSIASSGATPGGGATGNNKAFIEPDKNNNLNTQIAGIQTTGTIQKQMLAWCNPDQAPQITSKGIAAQIAANVIYEIPTMGWEAELKLIGDSSYYNPFNVGFPTIAIIVINPFYISGGKWVVTSACNPLLSNSNYFLVGVDHQINGASFITTLKVKLLTPNVTEGATDNFGVPTSIFESDAPTDADNSMGSYA